MIEIPRTPVDLTLNWLNRSIAEFGRIDRKIQGFQMSVPTPQGLSSVTRKLHVNWADGEPGSLYLKMMNLLSPFIDLHREMGAYRTEVGFYKSICEAGLRVPQCYVAEVDPETQEFVLLLEDVGPGRGLENLEDAKLAILNLARFHGQWWGNVDLLGYDWLKVSFDRSLQLVAVAENELAQFDENPDLRPLMESEVRQTLMLLFENRAAWADHRLHASSTLCHGDYHPLQMFFPTEHNDFVVFDWQFAEYGSGAVDLVFFLAKALTNEQYQSQGSVLIEKYYRVLCEFVSGYSRDEFRADLGHAAIVVLLIHLLLFPTTNLDEAKATHMKRGSDWRSLMTYPSLLARDLGAHASVRNAIR